MLSRGKLIVLAILLLAAGLAVVNMIVQTRSSGRAVAHWGPEAARLMLAAERVEILKLEPVAAGAVDAPEAECLAVGSQRFAIRRRRDISQAPGALHVRRALVADGLYEWDSAGEAPLESPRWRYAMRFGSGEATFTLLLDEGCATVSPLDGARPLGVRPNDQGASPLREFVEEQFPP